MATMGQEGLEELRRRVTLLEEQNMLLRKTQNGLTTSPSSAVSQQGLISSNSGISEDTSTFGWGKDESRSPEETPREEDIIQQQLMRPLSTVSPTEKISKKSQKKNKYQFNRWNDKDEDRSATSSAITEPTGSLSSSTRSFFRRKKKRSQEQKKDKVVVVTVDEEDEENDDEDQSPLFSQKSEESVPRLMAMSSLGSAESVSRLVAPSSSAIISAASSSSSASSCKDNALRQSMSNSSRNSQASRSSRRSVSSCKDNGLRRSSSNGTRNSQASDSSRSSKGAEVARLRDRLENYAKEKLNSTKEIEKLKRELKYAQEAEEKECEEELGQLVKKISSIQPELEDALSTIRELQDQILQLKNSQQRNRAPNQPHNRSHASGYREQTALATANIGLQEQLKHTLQDVMQLRKVVLEKERVISLMSEPNKKDNSGGGGRSHKMASCGMDSARETISSLKSWSDWWLEALALSSPQTPQIQQHAHHAGSSPQLESLTFGGGSRNKGESCFARPVANTSTLLSRKTSSPSLPVSLTTSASAVGLIRPPSYARASQEAAAEQHTPMYPSRLQKSGGKTNKNNVRFSFSPPEPAEESHRTQEIDQLLHRIDVERQRRSRRDSNSSPLSNQLSTSAAMRPSPVPSRYSHLPSVEEEEENTQDKYHLNRTISELDERRYMPTYYEL